MDVRDMSNHELQLARTKLALQISELQTKFHQIKSEVCFRDAIMLERQAEASYRAGKKPTDPPTLREYWNERSKREKGEVTDAPQ